MFVGLINYIDLITSGKRAFIGLILSLVFGTIIITMLFGILKLNPDATMDSLTFYNSETFFNNLEIQGEEGRKSYLILHFFDYIFITQFYLIFVYLINLIAHKLELLWIRYLSLIPILSAFMDLCENISIDSSIFIYPQKLSFIGTLSGIFTWVKMISINLTLILVVLLTFALIIKIIKNKLSTKKI